MLEQPLKSGGMGSVWRAIHIGLDSHVAVKLIQPEYADDPAARARFVREARAAAALRSPHVVQMIDHGLHDERVPFMVMELLVGETLEDRLARGRLSVPQIARVMTHCARAAAKAHELGIVHRDLKPENIFLVDNDDEDDLIGLQAKVLDFGIAKVGEHGELALANTCSGSLLGTPQYMSPEQAHGDREVDHRTDLWSMAIITFQCICGRLPFQSAALGSLLVEICTGRIPPPSQFAVVPREFDLWFFRAAARDPNARFQSAKEQNDALRSALASVGGCTDISGTMPAVRLPALAAALDTVDANQLEPAEVKDEPAPNLRTTRAKVSSRLDFDPSTRAPRGTVAIVASVVIVATTVVLTLLVARAGKLGGAPVSAGEAPSAPAMSASTTTSAAGQLSK